MIKALRWRLVAVTMVLLSLVMGLVIYLFFNTTYQVMESDSLSALHLSGMRYGLHNAHPEGEEPLPEFPEDDRNKPDKDGLPEKPDKGPKDEGTLQKMAIPCFVVGLDHDGALYAKGTRYYDLTDTVYLEQILQEADATGKDHGVLGAYKLRFLRLDDICGTAFAFTDISHEQASLMRLMYQSLCIGLLAMTGFFIISLLISRWAVRPIDRVMQQQRQFIADASHELKTPLTVILTNAELLNNDYPPEVKEKFGSNILSMAQQMRGLVEELLDLARANNAERPVDLQPLDMSRLVADAVLPFEPLYFESGLQLESSIEEGISVKGSPEELKRVVDILLDNGCKYATAGTTVTLRLNRSCLHSCLLSVESQGETLSKQECRDIFKRFYRRDPNRSMNHSYGLGLSIAKTIIGRHNGQIWAQSSNGVNTFCVRLPYKKR